MPSAIAIEGPGADRALADFLAIEGISGSAQSTRPGKIYRDGGVLVAIGAVIGVASGIAQVVSSILDWRERWKKANENKPLSVTIEDARGNRLLLDNATPEQITVALQTLAR
jgi:hypothetical protein